MAGLNWQLKKFTIGIRHDKTFLISDIHGAIVDRVLALRKLGQLSKDYFTLMKRPDVARIILTDNDDQLILTCSIEGVIIQADVSETSLIDIDSVKTIYTKVVHSIIPLTEASEGINRIGVIYEYQIPDFDNSAKAIFSQFMKVNLAGTPDNMLIRLSLKNPAIESMINPSKKANYKNVIVTISSERTKNIDEKEMKEEKIEEKIPSIVNITADYQLYFVPPIKFKDVPLDGHLSDAEKYIENHIKEMQLNIE